jgi:hypothetical protein
MRGMIETNFTLTYAHPYWDKPIYKINCIDRLFPKTRLRYKTINMYNSGKYFLIQIYEIFEIN